MFIFGGVINIDTSYGSLPYCGSEESLGGKINVSENAPKLVTEMLEIWKFGD